MNIASTSLLNANHLKQIEDQQLSEFGVTNKSLRDDCNTYGSLVRDLVVGIALSADESLDMGLQVQAPVATRDDIIAYIDTISSLERKNNGADCDQVHRSPRMKIKPTKDDVYLPPLGGGSTARTANHKLWSLISEHASQLPLSNCEIVTRVVLGIKPGRFLFKCRKTDSIRRLSEEKITTKVGVAVAKFREVYDSSLQVRSEDVLGGPGHANHPGNIRLREFIKKYVEQSPTMGSSEFVKLIRGNISPGRFLSNCGFGWYPSTTAQVRSMIRYLRGQLHESIAESVLANLNPTPTTRSTAVEVSEQGGTSIHEQNEMEKPLMPKGANDVDQNASPNKGLVLEARERDGHVHPVAGVAGNPAPDDVLVTSVAVGDNNGDGGGSFVDMSEDENDDAVDHAVDDDSMDGGISMPTDKVPPQDTAVDSEANNPLDCQEVVNMTVLILEKYAGHAYATDDEKAFFQRHAKEYREREQSTTTR